MQEEDGTSPTEGAERLESEKIGGFNSPISALNGPSHSITGTATTT